LSEPPVTFLIILIQTAKECTKKITRLEFEPGVVLTAYVQNLKMNSIQKKAFMSTSIEAVLCPFCQEGSPKIRYRFQDCVILRCRNCTLMWLHPRPSRSQLYDIYGSMEYYSNKEFFNKDKSKIYGYVDYLAERINKQYGYRKIVRKVKEHYLRKNLSSAQKAKWLDAGCGLGFLMDVAFDEGFTVAGVEFSLPAIQYIRSKYTFPVKYGLLSEIDFSESYDVISMFDVIEHLIDPISDLQKLRQHIEDDGILIIQTMDCDSLASRLLGKKLEDFRRTREHLFFFNRSSLRKILEHCGWKILEVRLHGQTFQLSALIERTAVYSPILSRLLKAMIYPKWLLEANIFVNPGTKMLVFAGVKKG